MRADIVPGARFPDYELTDHTRTRRRLSELQGNDPMILILSRATTAQGSPAAPRTCCLLSKDRSGLY